MDRIVWKIILDIIVLACVGLPCLFLMLWGQPYERGYFEDDLSIRLPYREESIPEAILAGVGFAIIILTILIVEITRDYQDKNIGEKFLGSALIPGWIWESYTTIGVYCFGAGLQQLTTDMTKYVIGRLRPHFYDICRPIPHASTALHTLNYVQSFTCVNTDASQLKNMRLSFPSAHSSYAMYSAVFFVCYLQVKGKWRGSKLLRHGVQFAAFLSAWYVGLTRVAEHYHHWSDVGAGYLIGAVYGLLVFIYVLKPKKYGLIGAWDEPAPESVLPRPVLAR